MNIRIEKFPRPPDKRTNARRARTGADLSKAGWPSGSNNTQIDATVQALAEPRLERMIEHVHALGPRPLAEMLAEIARSTGQPDLVVDLVEKYARLDPEIVHALGADRFPPVPLEVVR